MTTTLRLALLAAATVLLGACSTIDRSTAPAIDRQAQWVVLPFANHTETPLAGQRAEAIAETILHSNGINKIKACCNRSGPGFICKCARAGGSRSKQICSSNCRSSQFCASSFAIPDKDNTNKFPKLDLNTSQDSTNSSLKVGI